MSNDVAGMTLCEVGDRIQAREISAVEVTESALRRAESSASELNAFISLAADQALDAARAADLQLDKGGASGLLTGIPLAHKDMYYRTGEISTCGSAIRRDFIADRTSTSLARLKAAGAIYLGGLNMSEFAVGPFGTNVHYGNCHNPWNLDCSPGGSSSGSGCAVAARIIYGALGSDTGGSIRIPSAMCGVVGIKPTQGRVSRYGLMPLSYSFDTSGPLTRTVRDAARILDVIAGHDPLDPTSSRQPQPGCEAACDAAESDGVRSMRIGIPSNYFYDDLPTDVAAALTASQEVYRNLGVQLTPVEVPNHDEINLVWAAALAAEAATIHRKWLRERPDDYGPMVRRRIEFGLYQPATRYIEALTLRDKIMTEYCERAFTNCDVLLTPTAPMTAPKLEEIDVGDSEEMPGLVLRISRSTRPVSYLGLPAMNVPCGFDASGLPVGLQLIGRPFGEASLCNLGHAYQLATAWHERVPPHAALPA